jgi:hypothetical protein
VNDIYRQNAAKSDNTPGVYRMLWDKFVPAH